MIVITRHMARVKWASIHRHTVLGCMDGGPERALGWKLVFLLYEIPRMPASFTLEDQHRQ